MSRQNIIGMNPADKSVTFQLRNGETRQYWYDPSDFIAILGGANPADFSGSQEPPTETLISGEIGTSLSEAVIDIAELGAL